MRRLRSEQGSVAVELALLAPVFALFLVVIIFAGRVAFAHQVLNAVAADAARAASISRTEAAAKSAAAQVARTGLTGQMTCISTAVSVDVSEFRRPVGTAASVSVTVACDVKAADLGVPFVESIRVDSSMSSPIDTYRERR
jgi:Flp pilus assembly protein TadG